MKIKLTPDSLEVQTFVISEDLPDRGTVGPYLETRPFIQCYSQHSCVYPCTDEPVECV